MISITLLQGCSIGSKRGSYKFGNLGIFCKFSSVSCHFQSVTMLIFVVSEISENDLEICWTSQIGSMEMEPKRGHVWRNSCMVEFVMAVNLDGVSRRSWMEATSVPHFQLHVPHIQQTEGVWACFILHLKCKVQLTLYYKGSFTDNIKDCMLHTISAVQHCLLLSARILSAEFSVNFVLST